MHVHDIAAAAAAAGGASKFPLRAESYAPLEADLRVEGWTRGLEAQGFDRSAPTVWIAEVRTRLHVRSGCRYVYGCDCTCTCTLHRCCRC